MRGNVIDDEIDLFACGLMRHHLRQKADELGTGVTRGGSADHVDSLLIEMDFNPSETTCIDVVETRCEKTGHHGCNRI